MNGDIKSIYDKYWHKRIQESENNDEDKKTPNEIFDTASSVLKEGKRILDIGCGDGSFYLWIEKKFKKIYGAEISKEAAQIAQKKGILVSLTNSNEYVPYNDNTFDAVSCIEVIEHLFDPLSAFKEIYRILRPNGQLVLTTPNIRYFRNLHKLIFKGEFPHTGLDTLMWKGEHLYYFTRKDINTILRLAGFKKIDFHINQDQFLRSKKRKFIRFLTGEKIFGEWFCGSITVSAYKEY